jgi:hypothetical protein
MAPQDIKDVARQLESARAELIAVVSSLTEAQARARPAPGRWSVLECLEHVKLHQRKIPTNAIARAELVCRRRLAGQKVSQ